MPIGRPDWYRAGLSQNVNSMDDMGELAVRLGAGVNYDRSGKVLYYDPFDRLDDLVNRVDGGLTVAPAVDADRKESGNGSMVLTITAGGSNYFTVSKLFRTWNAKNLSVEFALNAGVQPGDIVLTLSQRITTTKRLYGQITLNNGASDFYVATGGGSTLVDITASYGFASAFFTALKLDIDLENEVYRAFSVNDDYHDLTAYPLESGSSGAPIFVSGSMQVFAHATFATQLWIDRMILSEDI